MTAGRTNHTKFAAPPREPQPVAPSRDLGVLLDPEYAAELASAAPAKRRQQLTGDWNINGDPTDSE